MVDKPHESGHKTSPPFLQERPIPPKGTVGCHGQGASALARARHPFENGPIPTKGIVGCHGQGASALAREVLCPGEKPLELRSTTANQAGKLYHVQRHFARLPLQLMATSAVELAKQVTLGSQ